ncbi:hypothetical protein HanIR_Chr10g0451051 [Helianthus annuus]|nr:hypothetical protein HanIR_Chr10g0451051 [Helianthus annuus]
MWIFLTTHSHSIKIKYFLNIFSYYFGLNIVIYLTKLYRFDSLFTSQHLS